VSEIVFEASAGDAGARLDALAAARAGISRATASRLVDAGAVEVAGRTRPRSYRVAAGDVVRVTLPDAARERAPEPDATIDVEVRYEDRWLLVVSKPAGLVVHPGPGHPEGTLVNALLARAGRPAGGDLERPGIVHRLDAGTSGLMIVAKDAAVHEQLVEMLAAREVTRVYRALVDGLPDTPTGTIDAPVGRSPRHRKKMAVVDGGRDAVTDFRVTEAFGGAALLEVRPRTGRTHQIRVHLASIGHPVVGDILYGAPKKVEGRPSLERYFLHAHRIRFQRPSDRKEITVVSALPAELEAWMSRSEQPELPP